MSVRLQLNEDSTFSHRTLKKQTTKTKKMNQWLCMWTNVKRKIYTLLFAYSFFFLHFYFHFFQMMSFVLCAFVSFPTKSTSFFYFDCCCCCSRIKSVPSSTVHSESLLNITNNNNNMNYCYHCKCSYFASNNSNNNRIIVKVEIISS